MLDAPQAPDALARPLPAAVPIDPPTDPALPVAANALFAAAQTLLPALEAGRPLDAETLREAMTEAFGASDATGGWVWKDAYEAAEAAVVIFMQRYGRGMRRNAGDGGAAPHAGDAGGPRGVGALPHQAVGGAGASPAVLDAAAARLCRAPGRRDPAGRRRAGAVGRHRHAGGDGAVCARQLRRRQSPPQRICADSGAVADATVSRGRHHRVQRRDHRRPASRRPADGGADEPALFGDARRRPHHPRRRPPPRPLGRLDAAAGAAGW